MAAVGDSLFVVPLRACAQVVEATAAFSQKHPVIFTLHILLFSVLLQSCIPIEELWPNQGGWRDYPIMASVYGVLRLFRLALRCGVFTMCVLRCVKRDVQPSVAVGAFDSVVETAFSTIWPKERRAFSALVMYCIARCLKVVRLPMEAYVNNMGSLSFCTLISLGHGLCSRSAWILGLFLGFRYLNDPKNLSSPTQRPEEVLHPGTRKMLSSRGFHAHALLTASAWLLVSVAECTLLCRWQAGTPGIMHEIDALEYKKDVFEKSSFDLRKWSFSRVVVGSWREPFYLIMLFPTYALLGLTSATFLFFVCRSHATRTALTSILLGGLSYVFLISGHNLQFLILCLLVSWECFALQQRCETFQLAFAKLDKAQRAQQHDDLGKAMNDLSRRLQPIIVYLVAERGTHMALDIALLRCEAIPFTLVHYLFRHLVRILGVALVIWRIGRLNASIYDDLTGKICYELVSCHQRFLEMDPQELKLHRWELKDWITYISHNTAGSRKYCLRVCSFQCCLRAHTVAFWAVTFILLPVGQQVLSLVPRPNLM